MVEKNIIKLLRFVLVSFFIFSITQQSIACSGYKITIGNKTFFGSNEDAWRLTPHIWFEKGEKGCYGAAFTGSRYDGKNGYAPQSGMNEMGLAFERLASYHPKQKGFENRLTISNPTKYLKDILHNCKTVEEVKYFISKYNYSYFIEDIFIYVDKSGKYLIVEPFTLKIGNEPTYVFSNFCPSITSKQYANSLDRYRKGVDFLNKKIDTTFEFLIALSDTMHVCRNKIGDGTLLTSIWDINDGKINLYFYHDYKKTVQFNLTDELKKGDHIIAVSSLFPFNYEFEKLRNYKIPQNSNKILFFLIASGALFFMTSFFFLIKIFSKKIIIKFSYLQSFLVPFGLLMFYYLYVLISNMNVFYFKAPYKDPNNKLVTLSSHIPFLLCLIIIPLGTINFKLFKVNSWSILSKCIITLNTLAYVILFGFFVYWRFYNI